MELNKQDIRTRIGNTPTCALCGEQHGTDADCANVDPDQLNKVIHGTCIDPSESERATASFLPDGPKDVGE
jgi:hypothetical protein